MRVISLLVLFFVACGPDSLSDASLNAVNNMQTPAKIAAYQKHLPQVAYPELNEILRSSRTYWYDSTTIIPAYQDNNGSPIGVRDNSSGSKIDLARHLFKGQHWIYPFGHTAGTDESQNVVVANFLHLPQTQSAQIPLGYFIYRRGDEKTFRWIYPKNTVVGEVIYIKAPDGDLYVAEIRTRKKYGNSWATNVYRPFPTASHLSTAIKQHRPQYQQDASLVALIQHLENNATVTPYTRQPKLAAQPIDAGGNIRGEQVVQTIENRMKKVFDGEGALDVIPAINDDQLVKDLLSKTTFISSYNLPWKKNGQLATFAASTTDNFSVVPDNYQAGLIAVNEVSCQRCHEHAGNPIKMFDAYATAYGLMWGNDGIFSFQPFETSEFYRKEADNLGQHIINFNNENRSIRREFIENNIIKQIDEANPGNYQEQPRATLGQ